MEQFIANLPEVFVVLIVLAVGIYFGPTAKEAMYEFMIAYKASEMRKKILEGVIFAREQYETNQEIIDHVVNFLDEKYPTLHLNKTEISQQILAVLEMLEKNLDVSRYTSR